MKYELYSGAGNDFVMIDNITEGIALDKQQELTIKLCRENFPKIDGVIFADKPLKDDSAVRMNYYNRDGSFGAMCGNGARCIAMFAFKNGITGKKKFTLEAVEDTYSAEILSDEIVTIGFPEPKEIRTDIKVEMDAEDEVQPVLVSFVNVGSDHIVLFIDEEINKLFLNTGMDKLNADNLGRLLRFHKDFEPRGGNVNFAEIMPDKTIRLRTYERGVERETLACGTGIISTGIIAMMKKDFKAPVKIRVQSGEVLTVNCKMKDGKLTDLSLTGSAKKIDEGNI
ncbi:MAG: diaminopimelate epimerase [Ignavibacteria bacterium]